MSIYKPVSSISNSLMSIGGSLLGGIASGLGSKFGSGLGGSLGKAALNIGVSAVSRKVAGVIQPLAYSADSFLQKQLTNLTESDGINLFSEDASLSKGALEIAGGLSFQDMWEIVQETDAYSLSRKNFYILEINDRSGSAPTDKDGSKHNKFNLLTTNLSFSPITINSEAVQIGSIELDKLQSSGRTEMTLTCLDDSMGTIKNWASQRASSVAPSDGTFLPPYFYLFDVKVIFGTNVENSDYYNETYTMRISEMSHELSRESQALENVSLKFTQWDTCMPTFF